MGISVLDRVSLDQVPGASRLIRALADNDSGLSSFVKLLDPDRPPAPSRPIPADLAEALLRDNLRWGAGGPVKTSIDKLASGAGVVAAGQQAGLLLGPIYTLYKAVQAVTLARRLEAATGRPYVPLFWSETEDHDLDEVKSAFFHHPAGKVELAEYPFGKVGEGTPVGLIPLGEEKQRFMDFLRSGLIATDFTPDVLQWVNDALEPSATWGEWFNRLLVGLLGKHGLVVADSLCPAFKAAAGETAVRSAKEGLKIAAAVNETGERLRSAGFRHQVHLVSGRLPFFLILGGKRVRVMEKGGKVRLEGREMSRGELTAMIQNDPSVFSPNVVSRPLVMGAVFGEMIHITGPSETAYFAQLGPAFDLLDIPRPHLVPRVGLTLIEPMVTRLSKNHSLSPKDLFSSPGILRKKMIGRPKTRFDDHFWSRWQKTALSPMEKVRQQFPEGSRPFSASSREEVQIKRSLDHLRRAVDRELEGDQSLVEGRLERLLAFLRPLGKPQERVYSPVSYFNRYGFGLGDDLTASFPTDWRRHHLIRIEP